MRFSSPKMHQIQNFSGLRPGPRWGSSQRSPRLPSWWGGGLLRMLPPPQEPLPRSRPFGPRTQHTHILLRGAAYAAGAKVTAVVRPGLPRGPWVVHVTTGPLRYCRNGK